jgi:hypothetical protein
MENRNALTLYDLIIILIKWIVKVNLWCYFHNIIDIQKKVLTEIKYQSQILIQ